MNSRCAKPLKAKAASSVLHNHMKRSYMEGDPRHYSYLSGQCGAVQDVPWPEELRRHGHGGQGETHVAASVESRVQVMLVVEHMLADGVMDQGQYDGEPSETDQHQQSCFLACQNWAHAGGGRS